MPAGWAAAAAAVVGVAGAGAQADAGRSAANAQGDAAKKGTGEMRREFDIGQEQTAPWRDVGKGAIYDLGTLLGQERGGVAQFGSDPRYKAIYDDIYRNADMVHRQKYGGRALSVAQSVDPDNYAATMKGLEEQAVSQFAAQFPDAAAATNKTDPNFGQATRKFTMDDFKADPVSQASFEFGLSEGEKAVKRMFGSRGLSRSGAAVKAATRFATDFTGTKAGESRDRFVQDQSNLYNKLAGVSGTGQVTATNNASNAMTMGANAAQMTVGTGNARGAATIAQGNAIAGAANNVGSAANSAYWLNRAFPDASTSSTPPSNFYYTGDTAAGGAQYG